MGRNNTRPTSLTFSFSGSNEVLRFFLNEDGLIDVQFSPGFNVTEAARKFIEICNDNLPGLSALVDQAERQITKPN